MGDLVASSFETARSAHYRVVWAAVTLAVLAALPSDAEHYTNAQRELDAWYALVINDFDDFYSLAERQATVALAKHGDELNEVARRHGIGGAQDRKPAEWMPWRVETPGTTLEEASGFLSRPGSVLVFVPAGDGLSRGLSQAFQGVEAGGTRTLKDLRTDLGTGVTSDLTENTSTITLTAGVQTETSLLGQYVATELRGRVERIGPAARDWVRSKALPVPLIVESGSSVVVFPALRGIWSEVRGKDIDSATEWVTQRVWESARKVELLGITVPEGLIVVAGPAVLLGLLIQLGLDIAHLRRVRRRDPSAYTATADIFAWFGLYPERLARLLLLLSVCVLPALAATMVVARYGAWGHADTWAAVLITLAVLASGINTAWSFGRLNDSPRQPVSLLEEQAQRSVSQPEAQKPHAVPKPKGKSR